MRKYIFIEGEKVNIKIKDTERAIISQKLQNGPENIRVEFLKHGIEKLLSELSVQFSS